MRDTTTENDQPQGWGKFTVAIFLMGLPLPPLGFILYRPITNEAQAAVIGGGLLVPLLFALVVFVTSIAGLHRYKVRRLVNFGIIFGFALVGLGTAALANGALDPHPLVEHETLVLHVPSMINRQGSGFRVEDWREGHRGDDFLLSDPPAGIRAGDRVIVVVGRGLFGMWLDEVRTAPSQ